MPVMVGIVLDLIAGKLLLPFKQVDFSNVQLKTRTAIYTVSTLMLLAASAFLGLLTCQACMVLA